MTQTIAQTSAEDAQSLQSGGRPLWASHSQLVSILRSRLGVAHAQLLATPVPQPDGGVRWDSPLEGAVLASDDLGEDQASAVLTRASQLVDDIRKLAKDLHLQGASSSVVANMLEQALQTPPGNWLYSVEGEPVLVLWGHGAPPAAPPTAAKSVAATTLSASANSVAAAKAAAAWAAAGKLDAVDPAEAAPAAVAIAPARSPAWRRWLPWSLLLLLMVIMLLLGMRQCQGPADDLARLAEIEKLNKAYEDQLRRQRGNDQRFICVPDPVASAAPPVASQPEPRASIPSAPEPVPSAAGEPPPPPVDPYAELKKRVDNTKDCDQLLSLSKDKLLRNKDADAAELRKKLQSALAGANCKEQAIKQAINQCPGDRPKELAPQVAMVFDASRSMSWSLTATPEDIARGQASEGLANTKLPGALGNLMRDIGQKGMDRLYREPLRITPARDAAGRLVRSMPSDVDVSLTMVDDCDTGARNMGSFPPARRGELLDRIQAIEPRAGTPLADGVAKAGALLDGVNRESIMVVISDGQESCPNANPCAVAAELARTKPHLKINVIDITGAGAGNCLASATGGKVFTAKSADDIATMIQQAGQDAVGPQDCKKR